MSDVHDLGLILMERLETQDAKITGLEDELDRFRQLAHHLRVASDAVAMAAEKMEEPR